MREERSSIGTGILLVAVGLLFLADRQGLLSFARLWPLLLIVLGAVMILFPGDAVEMGMVAGRRGARRRNRYSGGFWMVFVGILFLANQNHWMSVRDSWPLFIVAGGLSLIIGSISRRPVIDSPSSSTTTSTINDGTDQTGGSWR